MNFTWNCIDLIKDIEWGKLLVPGTKKPKVYLQMKCVGGKMESGGRCLPCLFNANNIKTHKNAKTGNEEIQKGKLAYKNTTAFVRPWRMADAKRRGPRFAAYFPLKQDRGIAIQVFQD